MLSSVPTSINLPCGSDNLTPEFAATVHPRIAVISVGRHNTFGHPAATTVET
jgi:competence protein ComEC